MVETEDDRRMAAHERDSHTAIQLAELRGDIKGHGELNKQRFDQIDGALKDVKEDVQEVRTDLTKRIDNHEADEKEEMKPQWEKLDTVRRMVWIAVGSIVILAGVIAFGLSAIQRYLH